MKGTDMADPNASITLPGIIYRAEAVTPSDATTIDTTSSLYVGVSGDIVVTMPAGNDVTFEGIQGFVPIRVSAVKATGTTATGIVACYF